MLERNMDLTHLKKLKLHREYHTSMPRACTIPHAHTSFSSCGYKSGMQVFLLLAQPQPIATTHFGYLLLGACYSSAYAHINNSSAKLVEHLRFGPSFLSDVGN